MAEVETEACQPHDERREADRGQRQFEAISAGEPRPVSARRMMPEDVSGVNEHQEQQEVTGTRKPLRSVAPEPHDKSGRQEQQQKVNRPERWKLMERQ
jgi:hypothetical protein